MIQIRSYVSLLMILELWSVTECSLANRDCNVSRDYEFSSGTVFSPTLWLKYRNFVDEQYRKGIKRPENLTTGLIATAYLTGGKGYYRYPDEILSKEEIAERDPNDYRHSENCSVDACHFSVIFGNQSAQRLLYHAVYKSPEKNPISNGDIVVRWPTVGQGDNNNSTIAHISVKDKCDGIPRIFEDSLYIFRGGVGHKYVAMNIRRNQTQKIPYDYSVSIFAQMDTK